MLTDSTPCSREPSEHGVALSDSLRQLGEPSEAKVPRVLTSAPPSGPGALTCSVGHTPVLCRESPCSSRGLGGMISERRGVDTWIAQHEVYGEAYYTLRQWEVS